MIDDNCNNQVDEACDGGSCSPNGTFTLDAGVISLACCGAVNLNITRFVLSGTTATVATPQSSTSGPLSVIGGVGPTCPSGSFTYRVQLGSNPSSFTCVEVYTLTGNFVGPDTFVGTFSANFSGAACSNALCTFGGPPCVSQTWNISAGR